MSRKLKGEEINFKLSEYSTEYAEQLKKFNCGNPVINEYILNKAKDDISTVTYLVINTDTNDVIGFISLACSGIRYTISTGKNYHVNETKPAIEIKYFAVINKFHKLLYDDTDEHIYFSDMVLGEALKKCRDISEKVIGAEYIMLYAVEEAVHFYERNLFETYAEYMSRDNIRFLDGCVPMYMPL